MAEKSSSKKGKGEAINIMADKLEQINAENKIIGIGNVKVKFSTTRISADRIELNTETGFGTARGNVVLIDEVKSQKVKCPLMLFNIHNQKATLYNSKGFIANEYYFHGKKVERKSEDHYVVTDGDITSCFGKNPFWKFECSKVDAHVGSYAFLHDPKFLIKDIPVFYAPYGYIPLDTARSTGFLIPKFGTSNEDGTFFNNAFFWAINEQWDATFGLDYLSKRGIRPSAELRYYTDPHTIGRWYADFLKDRATGETFWQILVEHKQRIFSDIDIAANIEWLAGSEYDKIYSSSVEERTRRETDNFLTITKNWENRSLFIETRYHKSLEPSVGSESGTLPQITFRNQLQKLGKTPFYFELDTSYTNFANKPNASSTLELTQRFDVHPQISMPINKWPWLNITPRFGIRETIYDHGKTTASASYSEPQLRTVYNFDTTVTGPSFTKTFLSKKKGGASYKHLIEPRVTYNYIPDIGQVANRISITDGIDSLREVNRTRFSLINRLFKKVPQGDSFITKEIARFELSQSYDFLADKNAQGSKAFSDLRFDLDSRLTEKLMFNFDGTYDVNESWLKSLNVEMVFKPWDNFGFYVERRYIRDSSTDVLGTIRWGITKNWQFDLTTRYDELKKRFNENDVSLFYRTQCWGVGLDVIKRTNYTQGEAKDDTRFLFQLELKGLGAFGSAGKKMLHRRF